MDRVVVIGVDRTSARTLPAWCALARPRWSRRCRSTPSFTGYRRGGGEPYGLGRHLSQWLVRFRATDGGIEQIDKKLLDGFESRLGTGMGDRRELLRIVGAQKAVSLEALRGTRDAVPGDALAGKVRLDKMNAATAKVILTEPAEWPADVVARAIQEAARDLNKLEPVSELADSDGWFAEP